MDISDLQHDIESASRSYADGLGIDRNNDWLVLKLNEEVGELTQAHLARTGQARDRGRTPDQLDGDFRAEVADVLGHVLLIAERFHIDLTAETRHKWLTREPPR